MLYDDSDAERYERVKEREKERRPNSIENQPIKYVPGIFALVDTPAPVCNTNCAPASSLNSFITTATASSISLFESSRSSAFSSIDRFRRALFSIRLSSERTFAFPCTERSFDSSDVLSLGGVATTFLISRSSFSRASRFCNAETCLSRFFVVRVVDDGASGLPRSVVSVILCGMSSVIFP